MKRSDEDILTEARDIARLKRCFIVRIPGCWVVYRKAWPSNVRIGKRAKASDLLKLVKTC